MKNQDKHNIRRKSKYANDPEYRFRIINANRKRRGNRLLNSLDEIKGSSHVR